MNNSYNASGYGQSAYSEADNKLKKKSDMLIIKEPDMPIRTYLLEKAEVVLGRRPDCDVVFQSKLVSNVHAKLIYDLKTDAWIIQEYTDNTNGTFINDHKLQKTPGTKYSDGFTLEDGCILRIDSMQLIHQLGVIIIFSRSISKKDEWKTVSLKDVSEFHIGRDQSNQLVFDLLDIDRVHAVITHDEEGYLIADKRTVNGTFVHDTKVPGTKPVRLRDRDVIRIASKMMILWDTDLIYSVPTVIVASQAKRSTVTPSGIGIHVKNLSLAVDATKSDYNGTCKHEIRDGKKYLLNNVSFDISPGSLVAILGGSGAGKTTLVNCLNGITQNPVYTGSIKYATVEFKTDYKGLAASIGIAPQSDPVYDYLTVKHMLMYAAKLRVVGSASRSEIEARVNKAIEMVGLKDKEGELIKKLSGGQRKRASIAAELICDTKTLYLDEPTSGLDPETEVGLMTQLREIADKEGKTIIVITHTLQSLGFFDKIIFMAPGGYLSAEGTRDELLAYYGVEDLIKAYEVVSREQHRGRN